MIDGGAYEHDGRKYYGSGREVNPLPRHPDFAQPFDSMPAKSECESVAVGNTEDAFGDLLSRLEKAQADLIANASRTQDLIAQYRKLEYLLRLSVTRWKCAAAVLGVVALATLYALWGMFS